MEDLEARLAQLALSTLSSLGAITEAVKANQVTLDALAIEAETIEKATPEKQALFVTRAAAANVKYQKATIDLIEPMLSMVTDFSGDIAEMVADQMDDSE